MTNFNGNIMQKIEKNRVNECQDGLFLMFAGITG